MIFLQQKLAYSPEILKYYRLSGDVVSYFVFVLAIIAIVNYKKFQNSYKWLFINIILSAFLELSSNFLVKNGAKNTQFINHIYIFQEIFTLGMFYYFTFKNDKIKIWYKYILILFLGAIAINAFWKDGYLETPSKLAFLENIIFSVSALIIFRELSYYKKLISYRKTPLFWFNLYIFTTFISIALFFLFIDKALKTSDNVAMILYIIKNSIGIVCYIFWIIGTLKLKRKT